MSTQKNSISVLTIFIMVALALLVPGLSFAGSLEPSDPPGPTMRTLDEIYSTNSWSKKLPCDSQTNCPRFEVLADFNNEAVLDKETGLVWEKAPRQGNTQDWNTAQSDCNLLVDVGGRQGWRLPTLQELTSLTFTDVSKGWALPGGHPFSNVRSDIYWSATTTASNTSTAWFVWFGNGAGGGEPKTNRHYVWCVRGGQGVDPQ